MFSVNQKRMIADAVQRILRETQHPEPPEGEISFKLEVAGARNWSWAEIRNNGAVTDPDVNPHNEAQDRHIIPPAVLSWLATREWGKVVPLTVIEYPEGNPHDVSRSEKHDYYQLNFALNADEIGFLMVPDAFVESLK